MALQHVILGCLMEFPTYGYQMLKSVYRDFYGHGPEVNDGQLYNTLKKMENEGLITRELVHQEKSPDKKIIFATDKGIAEFLEWLHSGENEQEVARYNFFSEYRFLNKCNFFNHLSPDEAVEKINKQLALAENALQSLLSARESMVRKKVSRHRIMILDYGIEVQKTRENWLRKFLLLYREGKTDEEA